MASVYNPGVLGIKTPENCGCQELLSKLNLVQHGWLRKRCFRNKIQIHFFNWPQLYVLLGDSCLYYFNNEMSNKPSGAISLYGYNRIIRASEVKIKEAPWAFKLEHIQPDVKSLYFSASSEQEMIRWMKAIKSEMLVANNIKQNSNIPKQALSKPSLDSLSLGSNFSWSSSEYNDLEGSIYMDSQEPRRSVYWDAMPTEYDMASTVENSLAEGYSLQTMPSAPGDKKADAYWGNVHYSGNKVKAAEIIKAIGESGVYLIRKSEDNSNVLVVFSKNATRKFKIHQKENRKLTLSLQMGPDFQKLEELLYHYYFNDLPGLNEKLVIPYKQHPNYKDC
ncbi:unnamed protein product [Lymnaea stagnalis]|uniref:SH2 domain-containing protein n=1 Tax=Lymnaea stagnalis TaxID=6523 RepID=A0AAV2HZP0_LYMST